MRLIFGNLSPLRGYGVHTNIRVVHLSRLGIHSEFHSASHLKMTEREIYSSP
ncbi:hypothetical protein IQ244_05620 [Nostoc sp. LEGE 06077]|nr:hypothetical protein [Nostoc sp. LEGE 06077]